MNRAEPGVSHDASLLGTLNIGAPNTQTVRPTDWFIGQNAPANNEIGFSDVLSGIWDVTELGIKGYGAYLDTQRENAPASGTVFQIPGGSAGAGGDMTFLLMIAAAIGVVLLVVM